MVKAEKTKNNYSENNYNLECLKSEPAGPVEPQ